MLKVAFIIYRRWGYEIFKEILKFQKTKPGFTLDTLIVCDDIDFSLDEKFDTQVKIYRVSGKDNKKIFQILSDHQIQIACFYSWSFIISQDLIDNFICLCLHPSPLPKYRGGTPIQHQLVNGETKSAVTIFKMAAGIDDGDIFAQRPMSLSGTVLDIFDRMTKIGGSITKKLITQAIKGELKFVPQTKSQSAVVYKRRKPAESEIKIANLKNLSFLELYNLVRGLLGPYPRVYLSFPEGKILIDEIKVRHGKNHSDLIDEKTDLNVLKKTNRLYLKLKDQVVELTKYSIETI